MPDDSVLFALDPARLAPDQKGVRQTDILDLNRSSLSVLADPDVTGTTAA